MAPRHFLLFFCCSLLFINSRVLAQIKNNLKISQHTAANSFPLLSHTATADFYYDANDAGVVKIAAEAFSNDIKLISGKQIKLKTGTLITGGYAIIAGTIGQSKIIDELIKNKLVEVTAIKNKWECFTIQIIKGNNNLKSTRPSFQGEGALVITGSDRRGTAFGIFQLSRLMGISPFVWWADVKPDKKQQLFVSGSYTSETPSVQYRGIFINDEDWGMQPWAAKNMDKDIKDIGPKTYARVFELLLRLKANYIWPAMHPCTKAFYYYKENPKVADDYAIVVGGSHCEPMLRNNVCEWAETYEEEYKKKPGEWRYDLNKEEIYKYWDDRIKESVKYESVFTVGMRGVHDGSMPGPKDPDEKVKLLEHVITDQREILQHNFNKSPDALPQIFVPYKEVLSLYRRGMKLPDDVTIIWPDDNYGYIRQLPTETEQKRSGGHGVYYHLSYWGSPQDYLWLSSISPSLIAYEMNKAYQYNAKKLWVFNVGDIKPAEMEIQFAMDMAWDVKKYNPATAHSYALEWATEIFGKANAVAIAAIKKEYYELAQSAKPEHLGMVLFTKQEMDNRLSRYNAIASRAAAVQKLIPAGLQDAYFQLVFYPVVCSELMNEKVFYTRKGATEKAMESYDSIRLLTVQYNTTIAGGKWNGMMNFQPRELKIFNAPVNGDSMRLIKDTLSGNEPLLVLNAADFEQKPGPEFKTIKALGINGNGLMLATTSTANTAISDSAFAMYTFNLSRGHYTVVVKCLPDFALNAGRKLIYGIAMNKELPQWINVNAEAETAAWKQNVVNGFSYGVSNHTLVADGRIQLKLWLIDANLVVNTIEIYKAD
jgi:Glycosyl hydrolase family 115/Gylcosyl hydrolase family 115 C-terminal domain